MDRPNTDLAAAVEAVMALPNRQEGVARLLKLRVPDATIARLLCERANPKQRRRGTTPAR